MFLGGIARARLLVVQGLLLLRNQIVRVVVFNVVSVVIALRYVFYF